jgi:hypothetical protein
MSHKHIHVQKASGKMETFSESKLRNSLMRSNATYEEANSIITQLQSEIVNGISTNKIYSLAFRLLKKQNSHNASRYNLKNGMMELGPSGYPFEKFIAALFRAQGYQTETGLILQGKCITHEVDVKCKKDGELMLMECKYKNQGGLSVDVKVPLYINSRFEDLLHNSSELGHYKIFKGWIVTNSRFTDDAKAYGTCKNIHLMSWDYPAKFALKDLIDQTGLYPVTCLSSLLQEEKKALLDENIILAKDLCFNRKILNRIGVKEPRIDEILSEAKRLCELSV